MSEKTSIEEKNKFIKYNKRSNKGREMKNKTIKMAKISENICPILIECLPEQADLQQLYNNVNSALVFGNACL